MISTMAVKDRINEILVENEELKIANAYNQSLINVYNTWFKSIGGIEDVSTQEELLNFRCSNYSRPITTHYIRFPALRYTTDTSDKVVEALNYASENVQYCELCNDKKEVYLRYGDDINFCPKCGRILQY